MGMKISQNKRIRWKLMDRLIPGHSRIKADIAGRTWEPVICFYFQEPEDDPIDNIVEDVYKRQVYEGADWRLY